MREQAQDTDRGAQHEIVELSFPASVDLVVLARFTAAAVAARAGFDIDEIEDLRLAVDELCLSFGPLERHRSVRLQYESTADSVRIVCEFDPLDIRTIDNGQAEAGVIGRARAEEFSMQLLDALVDDHGREQSDGTRCAWLEKRRGSHNS